MSWDDLRYLEVLSRRGSAQAAARELGVSASTIYRRVAALETELGSACLVKGSGTGELTANGQRLVAMAREIRTGMGKIRSLSEADKGVLSGTVGLTTVDGIVPLLLAPLRELTADFPGLSIDLIVGDSGPSVRKHQVDVAIGVMARPPEELIGKRLFAIEYAVYRSSNFQEQDSSRWIRRGPPITFTPESEWEDQQEGESVIRSGTLSAMLSMAQGGLGLALLPKRLAQLQPELVEVVRYRESLQSLPMRKAWLLVHPDMRNTPKIRALFDRICEHLEE